MSSHDGRRRGESQPTVEHQHGGVVHRFADLCCNGDEPGGGLRHVVSVDLGGHHPGGPVKFPVVLVGSISALDHVRHPNLS